MVRAVADKGYESVTISDVVEVAEVSKTTFYEEFSNKEECLFAAYDQLIEGVMRDVESAFDGEDPWPAAIRSGLARFLSFFAEEPALARMATVDVPAAGPAAQVRYRQAFERFLPLLRQGREYAELGDELPQHVELMAVGGAEAIIYDEVTAGRTADIQRLMPDILFTVLVPYLGPDDAAAEMRLATAV
jgi:AcrR family transcriptional regulator